MKDLFDIIETASLTEKASLLSEKLNKYVFRVSPKANKIEIKRAVEQLFNKKGKPLHPVLMADLKRMPKK